MYCVLFVFVIGIVLFYRAVPDDLKLKFDYHPAVCVVSSMTATTDIQRIRNNNKNEKIKINV